VGFVVPLAELEFRASRAGGPGGQHVNKASTRVEVLWDVARSPSLDDGQRERMVRRLKKRIDSSGVLHVIASERRSQLRNRLAAVERLQTIVTAALHEPKPRKRTKPPRSAAEARLRTQQRRADIKRTRGRAEEE
jgi:ribosome-associated protein